MIYLNKNGLLKNKKKCVIILYSLKINYKI